MEIPRELIEAVQHKRQILFVGAGVSATLKLPTWNELMGFLAEELGFSPEIFREYSDNTILAEYYALVKGPVGPLRGWMDREWHKEPERVNSSKVHQLITELPFPVIYTTNYDRWLEFAFESAKVPYRKICNIGDMQKVRTGDTQIVKFHGDFDDDDSLVLTESQFFNRLNFESPLDIKLRGDSLERGILFIGYRLADVNIRYLLFKLHRIWLGYGGAQMRPRSYVFLARPNLIEQRVLEERGVIPIISTADDAGEGLTEFLQGLSDALKSP